MKVNLLRDDQMSGVPHEKKDDNVMRFDDTFSGGNDDFYFQQPPPSSEEYKKPRRSRFWIFLLLLILFLLAGAFIANPQGTKNFFSRAGNKIADVWNDVFGTGRTRYDLSGEDISAGIKAEKEDEAAAAKDEAEDLPERQVIRVEKKVEKEVIRESTEEEVLESPPVYENIRDKLAVSKRNMRAAEFLWSKVPGGMILDHLRLTGDDLELAASSRYPMLITSYANVVGQHDLFDSVTTGDPELAGEMTRVRLRSELPPFRKADRPERIWDLDVDWFDDYLAQVEARADVNITQEITGSDTMEDPILRHDIHLTVNGSRSSMMLFFQELAEVPAAYTVNEIVSNYYPEDESNLLELKLTYYERK